MSRYVMYGHVREETETGVEMQYRYADTIC